MKGRQVWSWTRSLGRKEWPSGRKLIIKDSRDIEICVDFSQPALVKGLAKSGLNCNEAEREGDKTFNVILTELEDREAVKLGSADRVWATAQAIGGRHVRLIGAVA